MFNYVTLGGQVRNKQYYNTPSQIIWNHRSEIKYHCYFWYLMRMTTESQMDEWRINFTRALKLNYIWTKSNLWQAVIFFCSITSFQLLPVFVPVSVFPYDTVEYSVSWTGVGCDCSLWETTILPWRCNKVVSNYAIVVVGGVWFRCGTVKT